MNQLEVKPLNFGSYETKDLACQNCLKVYNNTEKLGALEALRVPAAYANSFCSRKCQDEHARKLDGKTT